MSLFVEDYIFYCDRSSGEPPSEPTLHRNLSGEWQDLLLARDICETLDAYKLLTVNSFTSIEQLQLHKSHRRSGGIQRLVLRLCLRNIEEAASFALLSTEQSLQICFESVPRIRTILSREMTSGDTETLNPRTGYVLHQLLKSIK